MITILRLHKPPVNRLKIYVVLSIAKNISQGIIEVGNHERLHDASNLNTRLVREGV